jgi:hypothetical protein
MGSARNYRLIMKRSYNALQQRRRNHGIRMKEEEYVAFGAISSDILLMLPTSTTCDNYPIC